MDERYETEWQWFRRSVRDSLLRPRRFAASLAREHYGLVGVLVALLAGFVLSFSVDALVIASKGLSVPDFVNRLAVDALVLGARLAAVAAVGIVLASVPLTLSDQVSRIEFTALAYEPTLAPVLAAQPPAGGVTTHGDGFDLTLPARWKEVHLGIAGELARFETDTDVLLVMRAAGSALVTPD